MMNNPWNIPDEYIEAYIIMNPEDALLTAAEDAIKAFATSDWQPLISFSQDDCNVLTEALIQQFKLHLQHKWQQLLVNCEVYRDDFMGD